MSERAFLRRVLVKARPDEVFDAIATLDGLRGWWTPLVEGSTSSGGDLRFEFEGLGQHIMMHVDASHQSTLVRWTCVRHTALPEWAGTKIAWSIQPLRDGVAELHLAHIGLTPELECFDHCEIGWDRFLSSIVGLIERGEGAPYRDDGSGTCSSRPRAVVKGD